MIIIYNYCTVVNLINSSNKYETVRVQAKGLVFDIYYIIGLCEKLSFSNSVISMVLLS